MEKQNCWEFFPTCRNFTCEARHDKTLDGVHGGENGGRACWTIAGTMRIGRRIENDRQKDKTLSMLGGIDILHPTLSLCGRSKEVENCRECEFYRKVQEEEGPVFLSAAKIFERLKDGRADLTWG